MTGIRALAIAALVAVTLSACAAPDPDASGSELYGHYCAQCHGDRLEGGTAIPLGPGSDAVDVTDEAIVAHVREGDAEAGMPAFNLSTAQIETIIGYLREVQAGGTP